MSENLYRRHASLAKTAGGSAREKGNSDDIEVGKISSSSVGNTEFRQTSCRHNDLATLEFPPSLRITIDNPGEGGVSRFTRIGKQEDKKKKKPRDTVSNPLYSERGGNMADKGKRSLDDSDSDSGPEDRNVEQPAKSSGGGAKRFKTSDGEVYFELEKLKRVTVREFRNKIYVDIREFYEKDGKMLPGKKGIALSTSMWIKLKNLIDDVDEEIQKVA